MPWLKTLDQFAFDYQPSIDRKRVRELSALSFVGRAQHVVLLGTPRVGKTHLAVALGIKAVEAGYSVLFLTLEAPMGRLVRARHENRLERSLQKLTYPKLLILDKTPVPTALTRGGLPLLSAAGPALRTRQPRGHQQQGLHRLG